MEYIYYFFRNEKVYLFSTTLVWYLLYRFSPTDLTRNCLSAVHATVVVASYLLHTNVEFLYYVSMGYYIADGIHELIDIFGPQNTKGTVALSQFGIVLHHIIMVFALGTLFDPANSPYFYKAYYYAELSNYPLYIRFHLRFINYTNRWVVTMVVFFQALAYIVLRLWMCGVLIHEMYINNAMNLGLYVMSSMLYIMSAVWAYKIYKQFLYKVKQL